MRARSHHEIDIHRAPDCVIEPIPRHFHWVSKVIPVGQCSSDSKKWSKLCLFDDLRCGDDLAQHSPCLQSFSPCCCFNCGVIEMIEAVSTWFRRVCVQFKDCASGNSVQLRHYGPLVTPWKARLHLPAGCGEWHGDEM